MARNMLVFIQCKLTGQLSSLMHFPLTLKKCSFPFKINPKILRAKKSEQNRASLQKLIAAFTIIEELSCIIIE